MIHYKLTTDQRIKALEEQQRRILKGQALPIHDHLARTQSLEVRLQDLEADQNALGDRISTLEGKTPHDPEIQVCPDCNSKAETYTTPAMPGFKTLMCPNKNCRVIFFKGRTS